MEYTVARWACQHWGMTSPILRALWPSAPELWTQWSMRLERISYILIALIIAVEVWAFPVSGYPLALLAIPPLVAGLILARRLPYWTIGCFTAAQAIVVLTGAESIGVWNAAVFVTFLLVIQGNPILLFTASFTVVSYTSVVAWTGWNFLEPVSMIAGLSVMCAGFAAAAFRSWVRYWQQVDARTQDALAARELEADRRIAQERLQIARDLHDAIGHDMAVVSVNLSKVEVATMLSDDSLRSSVADVRFGIQSVLGELQQTLRVLRAAPEERGPVARIDAIGSLIDSFRSIGDEIDTVLELPVGPVPSEVSSAAYRIVQEALTNAHKYGVGDTQVVIQDRESVVEITVTNRVSTGAGAGSAAGSGVGQPSSGLVLSNGLGLVGMRERVEGTGGNLDIQHEGGTFTVHAVLPKDGAQLKDGAHVKNSALPKTGE